MLLKFTNKTFLVYALIVTFQIIVATLIIFDERCEFLYSSKASTIILFVLLMSDRFAIKKALRKKLKASQNYRVSLGSSYILLHCQNSFVNCVIKYFFIIQIKFTTKFYSCSLNLVLTEIKINELSKNCDKL